MLSVNTDPSSDATCCAGSYLAFRHAFEAWPLRGATEKGSFVGFFNLADWQQWLAEADTVLSAVERQRIATRREKAHRNALTLAYALHRGLLGQAMGCEPQNVPIGRDEVGCPRLPAPLGLTTSLSHSGHRAVAVAITRTGPVGVDLEEITRAAIMPEIAEQVCHPADKRELANLEGQAANEAMLAIWVRKEAFLKAAGIGLQREMRTFGAPDKALLELPGGGWSQVRLLDAGPEWVAAVSSRPGMPLTCAWLHPPTP